MGNALGMLAGGLIAGTGETMEKINTRRYEQEARAAEFMKELSLYELKQGINAKYEKQKAADQQAIKDQEIYESGEPYQNEAGEWVVKIFNSKNQLIGTRKSADPDAIEKQKLEVEKSKVDALTTKNTLEKDDEARTKQAKIYNDAQSQVQKLSSDIDKLTIELSKTINEKSSIKSEANVVALQERLAELKLSHKAAETYLHNNTPDYILEGNKARADLLAKEKERLSKKEQEKLDKEVTDLATAIKQPDQSIEEAKLTVQAIRTAKPVEENVDALAAAYAEGDPQTRAEMEALKKYHEDYYMKVVKRAEELRQEKMGAATSGYLNHTSETDKRIQYQSPMLGRYNSMFQGE